MSRSSQSPDLKVSRVVAGIVQRRSDKCVLMVRRSRDASLFPSAWHFVTSSLESKHRGRCVERARLEILEVTGLADLAFRYNGRPLRVISAERTFIVHPVLFELVSPYPNQKIVLNASSHDMFEWSEPKDMAERQLLGLYDRVSAPDRFPENAKTSLRLLSDDRAPDASELGVVAARCLGQFVTAPEGASGSDYDNFMDFAWAVANARPSMATVGNAVLDVLHNIGCSSKAPIVPSSDLVLAAVDKFCSKAAAESRKIVDSVVEFLETSGKHCGAAGLRILTFSKSARLIEALLKYSKLHGKQLAMVIICESRPRNEGVDVAQRLSADGIPCTLITDAQVCLFACNADVAIVGTDSLRCHYDDDIDVINKVGTYSLALACRERQLPLFAIAGSSNIHHGVMPFDLEEMDPSDVLDGAVRSTGVIPMSFTVRNVYYEAVPSRFWQAIITESGSKSSSKFIPLAHERCRAFKDYFF